MTINKGILGSETSGEFVLKNHMYGFSGHFISDDPEDPDYLPTIFDVPHTPTPDSVQSEKLILADGQKKTKPWMR